MRMAIIGKMEAIGNYSHVNKLVDGLDKIEPLPPSKAYPAAFVVVAITTWALYVIQSWIADREGISTVRTYGIAYMVPIGAMVAFGGYRAGMFTLLLSMLAAIAVMDRQDDWHHYMFRNTMELVLIAVVGSLLVTVVEGFRYNSSLLKLVRETTERQRSFFRDVLASVTERRLWLCHESGELPPVLTPTGQKIDLSVEDIHSLRHAARDAATALDFPLHRVQDLITGVGEAAMNAVVHAGGGAGAISVDPRGTIQVRIEDHGHGIRLDQLPQATLERGYTTAGSLGHGFWIMLNTIDRISLLTGSDGTTIVLEQDRDPIEPSWIRKW